MNGLFLAQLSLAQVSEAPFFKHLEPLKRPLVVPCYRFGTMETTIKGLGFGVPQVDRIIPYYPPIMENQMKKKMKNKIETRGI